MRNPLVSLFLLAAAVATAAQPGGPAKCVGGTLPKLVSGLKGTIQTADADAFVFATRASTLRVRYDRIQSIEYGQEVGRRVVLAWVVSPIFLLTKARAHYLTLTFTDDAGQHQAIVLRVDKHSIRPVLAALETKSGHSVEYQDGEARKARRG